MANRLADETSPYLRQHQDNPVEWYAWGEAAFDAARERNVPILLSVGYSACHWCHVMAHECFEDAEVAAAMNAAFVNVKVDREERPDVDALYMDAVQAITGRGGWPMTVLATPDGKPVLGRHVLPEAAVPAGARRDRPTCGATDPPTISSRTRRRSSKRSTAAGCSQPADDLPGLDVGEHRSLQQLAGAFDVRLGRLRLGAEVPLDVPPRAGAANRS